MPTKEQYLGRINAIKAKQEEILDKDLEVYKAIKALIPEGRDTYGWIDEQKTENKKRWDMVEPKYQKALQEGNEVIEQKRKILIEETQKKIEEVNQKLITEKKKERVVIEDLQDLRLEKQTYEESLNALNNYQAGTSRTFSFGKAQWTLDITSYEPYYDAKTERDDLLFNLGNYETFVKTERIVLANEKIFNNGIKVMQDELAEKKNAFNGLNGWQKFWARVLPASWYNKAKDYADIKAQEQAMVEAGVPTEAPVQNTAPVQPMPEPLSEEQANNLEKETDLNMTLDLGKEAETIILDDKQANLNETVYLDDKQAEKNTNLNETVILNENQENLDNEPSVKQ